MDTYYEEWWESPRDPRTAIFAELHRVVRERLPDGEGQSALDVGSGKGAIVASLVERRYAVTAIELSPRFTARLAERFPSAHVLTVDARELPTEGRYDLATAIELLQNLDQTGAREVLRRLGQVARRIHLSISNRASLHGRWVEMRGFRLPFVHGHTPAELIGWLRESGFEVTYARGIGFLTPITLLRGFRLTLIPPAVAMRANRLLDPLFPGNCHIFYVEARKREGGTS